MITNKQINRAIIKVLGIPYNPSGLNLVNDDEYCFQLIVKNQMKIDMNNISIPELWIIEAFAEDGELRTAIFIQNYNLQ